MGVWARAALANVGPGDDEELFSLARGIRAPEVAVRLTTLKAIGSLCTGPGRSRRASSTRWATRTPPCSRPPFRRWPPWRTAAAVLKALKEVVERKDNYPLVRQSAQLAEDVLETQGQADRAHLPAGQGRPAPPAEWRAAACPAGWAT